MLPNKDECMIKSAAVQVCRVDELSSGYIGTGYSHSDCYDYLYQAYNLFARDYNPDFVVIEGFMLDNGLFVSREDALEYARYTGQLLPAYKDTVRLQSYMLDYSYLTKAVTE